jgi:hypothetical protein
MAAVSTGLAALELFAALAALFAVLLLAAGSQPLKSDARARILAKKIILLIHSPLRKKGMRGVSKTCRYRILSRRRRARGWR